MKYFPNEIDVRFVEKNRKYFNVEAVGENGYFCGTFYESDGNESGFLDENGKLTKISLPISSEYVDFSSINRAGVVAGSYVNGNTVYGFIYNGANLENFTASSDISMLNVSGITSNGEVFGTYADLNGDKYGFYYLNGNFNTMTSPSGGVINDITCVSSSGHVVGNYFSSKPGAAGEYREYGFEYDNGVVASLRNVKGGSVQQAIWVDNKGNIIGINNNNE